MAWITSSKEEQEFLVQLDQHPDRVAGILVAAIIDDRLTEAIKSHWYDMKVGGGGKVLTRLFGYDGPLANFGARINIGFGIGLYGEQMCKDMHAIREIRNKFAHKLTHKDFQDAKIIDLAMSLKLYERFPPKSDGEIQGYGPAQARTYTAFQRANSYLGVTQFKKTDEPRVRFMRCAEIIVVSLLFITSDPHWKKPVPEF